MNERLWRYETAYVGSIYVQLDKNKISHLEIVHQVFRAAQPFGFVKEVELVTLSEGDGAYLERLNDPKAKGNSNSDPLEVTTTSPSEKMISFIETHDDIDQMHFHLGAACYDETGQWRILGKAVTLSFYTEQNEADWGLYLKINSDNTIYPRSR